MDKFKKMLSGFIPIYIILATFGYEVGCTNEIAIGGNSSTTSVLSRKKRFFFPITTPWIFELRVTLNIPIQGLESSNTILTATVPFQWNLNTLRFLGYQGRSFSNKHLDRFFILKTLEDAIERYGEFENGHHCLLRAICEIAKHPVSGDGLLGDIFNLMLMPQSSLQALMTESSSFEGWQTDYLKAQNEGHFQKNCSRFETECPISLFQVVEMVAEDALLGENKNHWTFG